VKKEGGTITPITRRRRKKGGEGEAGWCKWGKGKPALIIPSPLRSTRRKKGGKKGKKKDALPPKLQGGRKKSGSPLIKSHSFHLI